MYPSSFWTKIPAFRQVCAMRFLEKQLRVKQPYRVIILKMTKTPQFYDAILPILRRFDQIEKSSCIASVLVLKIHLILELQH